MYCKLNKYPLLTFVVFTSRFTLNNDNFLNLYVLNHYKKYFVCFKYTYFENNWNFSIFSDPTNCKYIARQNGIESIGRLLSSMDEHIVLNSITALIYLYKNTTKDNLFHFSQTGIVQKIYSIKESSASNSRIQNLATIFLEHQDVASNTTCDQEASSGGYCCYNQENNETGHWWFYTCQRWFESNPHWFRCHRSRGLPQRTSISCHWYQVARSRNGSRFANDEISGRMPCERHRYDYSGTSLGEEVIHCTFQLHCKRSGCLRRRCQACSTV